MNKYYIFIAISYFKVTLHKKKVCDSLDSPKIP